MNFSPLYVLRGLALAIVGTVVLVLFYFAALIVGP